MRDKHRFVTLDLPSIAAPHFKPCGVVRKMQAGAVEVAGYPRNTYRLSASAKAVVRPAMPIASLEPTVNPRSRPQLSRTGPPENP